MHWPSKGPPGVNPMSLTKSSPRYTAVHQLLLLTTPFAPSKRFPSVRNAELSCNSAGCTAGTRCSAEFGLCCTEPTVAVFARPWIRQTGLSHCSEHRFSHHTAPCSHVPEQPVPNFAPCAHRFMPAPILCTMPVAWIGEADQLPFAALPPMLHSHANMAEADACPMPS